MNDTLRYKVVREVDGRLVSVFVPEHMALEYSTRKFTIPKSGGILVWTTLDRAIWWADWMKVLKGPCQVYLAECKVKMKLPTHPILWNNKFYIPGFAGWPWGTEAWRYVKLLKRLH